MVKLDALSTHIAQNLNLNQDKLRADNSPADATEQPSDKRPAGIQVSLSETGMAKSAEEKRANANSDIDNSGLPDATQKLLKMIREIKQKIEEKQAELQAAMTDQSLTPEARRDKVGALQTELGTLIASLATASNALDKQTRSGTMSPEDGKKAAMLALK